MKKLFYILAAAVLVSACGSSAPTFTRGEQYSKMYEEKPLTLLVLPPINESANVDAKELLYTSISRPLIEEGYYVISPLLAMDILKAESAYDAENFVEAPLKTFKQFFGADAVVFTEIKKWAKVGFSIETDLRMFIRSTTSGDILFDKTCNLSLDLSEKAEKDDSDLMLFVKLAASAIKTAATDHIQAARAANYFIVRDMPYGKYHPTNGMDDTYVADPPEIHETVKR